MRFELELELKWVGFFMMMMMMSLLGVQRGEERRRSEGEGFHSEGDFKVGMDISLLLPSSTYQVMRLSYPLVFVTHMHGLLGLVWLGLLEFAAHEIYVWVTRYMVH